MTDPSQQSTSPISTWLAQLAPILAGCGAGLAYVDERLSWLAWFALIPIGWVWSDRSQQSPKLATLLSGGLIYNGLALSWLRTCYAEGAEWFGPRAPAWLIISLLCAALFVAMWHYGQFLVRKLKLPVALAMPIAWVSMEFAKQYAGLIFVQMEFPWTKLGLTQAAWTHIAQVADLGGEPLLSLVICMANGAIVDALRLVHGATLLPAKRLAGGVAMGASLFLASAIYGEWCLRQSTNVPGPVVALMGELDMPPYLDENNAPSFSSSSAQPELLLWSELAWHHKLVDISPIAPAGFNSEIPDGLGGAAHLSLEDYRDFVAQGLLNSAAAVDAMLVLGCERLEQAPAGWRRFNSVACVNPVRRHIDVYDKQRLVPWGEYIPYTSADLRTTEQHYAPGEMRSCFEMPSGDESARGKPYNFCVSICYDLCFSQHFLTLEENSVKSQVDFLVHCGSEGQDPTGSLAEVMLKAAQLRAIENRRAIVRNVNFGYSGAIDSNGEILHKTARQPIRQPVMLTPLPIDCRVSGYTRWGDWPLGVLCGLTALFAWRKSYGE